MDVSYFSVFSGLLLRPSVTFYNFLRKGLAHLLLDLFSSRIVSLAFMIGNFLPLIFSD